MNIYLIKRIGKTCFDDYDGFVVTAESEGGAREVCMNHNESDSNTWFNPDESTCNIIGFTLLKESKMILSSYKAG